MVHLKLVVKFNPFFKRANLLKYTQNNKQKGMQMTTQRELYRRKEIAAILNENYKTIINWAKQGFIKEYKVDIKSRVPLYNLKEILQKLENKAG